MPVAPLPGVWTASMNRRGPALREGEQDDLDLTLESNVFDTVQSTRIDFGGNFHPISPPISGETSNGRGDVADHCGSPRFATPYGTGNMGCLGSFGNDTAPMPTRSGSQERDDRGRR